MPGAKAGCRDQPRHRDQDDAAQPETLAGAYNRALLAQGYDFLARQSELAAIRSDDLKFTQDGALKEMIRKSKTD